MNDSSGNGESVKLKERFAACRLILFKAVSGAQGMKRPEALYALQARPNDVHYSML